MQVDSKAYESDTRGEVVSNVHVSPNYFKTLDIPIVEGRAIDERDRPGAPYVAVINETMARRYWPEGSAVGRVVREVYQKRDYQIVGVAADHKVHSVGERPTPYVHFAAAQQMSRYNTIAARTRGDAAALLSSVRRELLQMEPGLVFVRQETMAATLATSMLPERVSAALAGAFGGLGTILAAIGLYGVIAYSVARRTREIGVRVALGAHPVQVLGMVMRQGLAVLSVGAVIGAALAALAARLLGRVIYGVGAADPVAWGAAFAILFVAAALANYIPARRAMQLDPVTALRTE
jgi:predicted permease